MALTMTSNIPDHLRLSESLAGHSTGCEGPQHDLTFTDTSQGQPTMLRASHYDSIRSGRTQNVGLSMQTGAHSASFQCGSRLSIASASVADRPSSSPAFDRWMASRTQNTPPFLIPRHLPAVSESGMITVTDYTPNEGEGNVPISVHVEMRGVENGSKFGSHASLTGMKLRLIFGRTAVKTVVKRLAQDGPEGLGSTDDILRLRLYANTPDHAECRFDDLKVPLAIQAMDSQSEKVETVVFGTFHYWTPTTSIQPAVIIELPPPSPIKRRREDDDEAIDAPRMIPGLGGALRLVRTSNVSADLLEDAEPAQLHWVEKEGSIAPEDIDQKWSYHELTEGRRLVRFTREMSGNRLQVSCEVIPQEDYDEEDIVISCVHRTETRNCWFTSVDIIYLLERLVGEPFCVEEKNRIRRNLEGLKPTTVSKTRGGFEAFFQRIMDFPPPKPRNIEKDVKVFPWSVLKEAIGKIISKYSVVVQPSSSSRSSQSGSTTGRRSKVARSHSSDDVSQAQDPAPQTSMMDLPLHDRPDSTFNTQREFPLLNALGRGISNAGPHDEFYSHTHFSEHGYPAQDGWDQHHLRRESSNRSIPPGPIYRADSFYDNADPMNEHSGALSNPYASNVTLAAMYPSSQGQSLSQSSLQGSGRVILHGPGGSGQHMDGAYLEDNFMPRHSPQTSDRFYYQQDTLDGGGAYETAPGQPDVQQDILYPHFQSSSNHNLGSDDVIEQHI